jgi:hypothetical protein
VYELSTVLQARTPDDLSPQKQAILAYANLKMQSNDFSLAICRKTSCFRRVWQGLEVAIAYIATEIKTNWQNAIKRSVNQKSNHAFFGLALYPLYQVYPALRDGGAFDLRVQQKRL